MGSPGAPQPAATQRAIRRAKSEKCGEGWLSAIGLAALGLGICDRLALEDVTAQILVLYDVRELLVNVGGVDLHRFLL